MLLDTIIWGRESEAGAREGDRAEKTEERAHQGDKAAALSVESFMGALLLTGDPR